MTQEELNRYAELDAKFQSRIQRIVEIKQACDRRASHWDIRHASFDGYIYITFKHKADDSDHYTERLPEEFMFASDTEITQHYIDEQHERALYDNDKFDLEQKHTRDPEYQQYLRLRRKFGP